MAHDWVDDALAQAREYERLAKELRSVVEGHLRLQQSRGAGQQTGYQPDAWTVADHLKILMEDGKKTFRRGELEQIMVREKMAGAPGSTDNVRLRAARTAIRVGKNKGYLSESEGPDQDPNNLITWIPGIWSNERLQK